MVVEPIKSQGTGIWVSVIVPIFNTEEFLCETIESVLKQSLTNFELILVNDGSTDGSAQICKKYMSLDTRIKYFRQRNSGVSIARNLGLSYASGKYVYFLDSDDTLDSEFLLSSYNISEQEGNDITILGEYLCNRPHSLTALPTCAQFLRMDFLRIHPTVRFPEGLQPCEDGLFSHRLLALTNRVGKNPKAIYHYRNHENQNHRIINKDCGKVLRQIPQWRYVLEDFYEEYNLQSKRAFHLAYFIEHEPFELRYLGMALSNEEKILLHGIVRAWMNQIITELSKQELKKLSKPFLYFVNAKNAADFDRFFLRYQYRRKVQKEMCLFLVRFIFLTKFRRRFRKSINERF